MTNLFHIPEILFRSLRDYFIDDTSILRLEDKFGRLPGHAAYFHDQREEGRRSWRHFMNVTKSSHWKNVKKELICLSLNRYYSMKYVKNESFRNRVLACLRNPLSQLALALNNFDLNLENELGICCLHAAHSISFLCNDWVHIPSLKNIYELDFTDCDALKRVEAIENVRILKFKRCSSLEYLPPLVDVDELDIWGCENLKDLSFISSETHLKLFQACYFTEMGDFSTVPFESLEYLLLDCGSYDDCPDFSAFHHVKELFIYQSSNFRDLTPFKKLITFDTDTRLDHGFENIKNLTSLVGGSNCFSKATPEALRLFSNLTYFRYTDCSEAFDLNSLSHTPAIELSSYTAPLPDFSPLRNVTYLDLSNSSVTDVSMLGKVKYLALWDCANIINFDGLGQGNIELSISGNYSLKNVSHLGTIRKLALVHCHNLKDITGIETVPFLSLKGCDLIKNLNILGKHQKQLDLTGCIQLKDDDLQCFTNVSDLNISCNHHITDLSMLTNVLYLKAACSFSLKYTEINGCDKLRVDLAYSKNLKMVTVNTNIHALSVYGIAQSPELYLYGKVDSLVDEYYIPFCDIRGQDEEDIRDFGFEEIFDDGDGDEEDDEDGEDDDDGVWEDMNDDDDNDGEGEEDAAEWEEDEN
jgi:hypothetical protein